MSVTRTEPDKKAGFTKSVTDAHGNEAFAHENSGSGPAHHKSKHPNGRFTGRHDAHGNEIWETPEKGKREAGEAAAN